MTWKRRTGVGVLAACALALLPAAPTAAHEPTVVPADNPIAKAVYSELAGLWWQWALSIPEPVNPLTDTTGEDCAQGQFKPLWFLAGTLPQTTPRPVERTCTIPAGRFVFFPVVNGFQANDPGGRDTFETVLRGARDSVAGATGMLTIDGKTIEPFYAESMRAFGLTLPEGNIFGASPGVYEPAAAAGLHVLLLPLPRGRHELRIQGSIGEASVDVTYHLTVRRGL